MRVNANPFRYSRAVYSEPRYGRTVAGDSPYRTIAGGLSDMVLYKVTLP